MDQAARCCVWCHEPLPLELRADARTCGPVCRKRLHRFAKHINALERADRALRVAVADPPYPGRAVLYRGHRDYRGEVNLDELLDELTTFDGWALATSAHPGLRQVLALAERRRLDVRVATWLRGERPQARARALCTWEPVIYSPARSLVQAEPPLDGLIYSPRARGGDPEWVIGAKPAPWWDWVFRLVGARAGDDFTDLFPGSGGGQRAWALAGEKEAGAGSIRE